MSTSVSAIEVPKLKTTNHYLVTASHHIHIMIEVDERDRPVNISFWDTGGGTPEMPTEFQKFLNADAEIIQWHLKSRIPYKVRAAIVSWLHERFPTTRPASDRDLPGGEDVYGYDGQI